MLGGLTGNDYPFLEGVYAAGGKGYFDAVGVHTDTACNILSPYEYLRGSDNRMIPDSFLAYREVHAVMVANGDDKPIWMTELSWRTTSASLLGRRCGPGRSAKASATQQQATYLRQAYHCMAQDPYVQVALWFPLVDERRRHLRADPRQRLAQALVRRDARLRPQRRHAERTMRGLHRADDRRRLALQPLAYSGPLPIVVSASSRSACSGSAWKSTGS